MWNGIHILPEWFWESHRRNGPGMRGMELMMPKSSIVNPSIPSSSTTTTTIINDAHPLLHPCHHHLIATITLPSPSSMAASHHIYCPRPAQQGRHQLNEHWTHRRQHGGFRVPCHWLQHGKHMTNDDNVIVHCCCFYFYTMWVAHPPSSQPTLLTMHTLHYHYYTTPPLHYTTPWPHNHHHHHTSATQSPPPSHQMTPCHANATATMQCHGHNTTPQPQHDDDDHHHTTLTTMQQGATLSLTMNN